MSTSHRAKGLPPTPSREGAVRPWLDLDIVANDAEMPIRPRYDGPCEHEALRLWADRRASQGPPFGARVMAYSGLGGPRETAQRLGLLQRLGCDAFLVACDLPSQLGFDPTHRLARSQVGRAGLSCATLDDFIAACAELDFAHLHSLGMLSNSVGHVGLATVIATLEHYQASDVRVMMQNDPLKEFTARGTEIYDPANAIRLACDCAAYALDTRLAGWPITVCSNHYDVAGTGPVVALAIALANAIAYVEELLARGYGIAEIHRTMMFFVNERSDFFVTASLFRMTRVLWSEILSDRFGLPIAEQTPATIMGYAHALEAVDEPLVNIARFTVSVTASMLGGVDYLCAAAYDEALRVPSADAAALAIRTMQVVGLEHGVTTSVDALAGSYKTRALDGQIYDAVTHELEEILVRGGAIECIENGYILSRMDDRRGTREQQIADGTRPWVGVNVAQAPDHRSLFAGSSVGEINFRAVEEAAKGRLAVTRTGRDDRLLASSLEAVTEAAAGTDNILPPTIAALKARATLQEIMDATTRGFAAKAAA